MRDDDLAALEETLEILSDTQAMADIREAHQEVARGEVIEGVDAVRRRVTCEIITVAPARKGAPL